MSFIYIPRVPHGTPKKKTRQLRWSGSASVLPQSSAVVHFTTDSEIMSELRKASEKSPINFALNSPVSASARYDGNLCSSFIMVHFQFNNLHAISQNTKILVQHQSVSNTIYEDDDEEESGSREVACTISMSAQKKFDDLVYEVVPAIAKVIMSGLNDANQLPPPTTSQNGHDVNSLRSALEAKPYLVAVLMDGILIFVQDAMVCGSINTLTVVIFICFLKIVSSFVINTMYSCHVHTLHI
jgi:hypothetical protein